MSLKALRSRFRNHEADQGSPSRLSFFHQVANLLGDDPEDQASQPDEEFAAFATDAAGENGAESVNAEPAAGPVGCAPLRNQQVQQLQLRGDDSCSDRDTDADDPAAVSRPRDRTARHRFAGRDKRTRSHRCKSLDRAGMALASASSAGSGPTDAQFQGNRAAVSDSGRSSRLPHHRVADWARELIDDLQSIDDVNDKDEEDPGNPLTLKRLKNNIIRAGQVTKPIGSFMDSSTSLRQWESPTASLLFIAVVSYSIWHGLVLPLLVTAAIWKLTVNYLISHGWFEHFGWSSYGRSRDESGPSGDKSASGVADRFALLLQVARNVQNRLGDICDAAEKVKNLLMWRHEACGRLYAILWLLLPVTLLVPADQLMAAAAFYLMFKCFVIDYAFLRLPKLRARYDSRLWQSLPTDADLDARSKAEQQGILSGAASGSAERTFWESFNLPPSEIPQPGWHNGQRCTLVNRDKSLTSSFKTGRLFLTNNYLCFERSKTHPQKNVVIALERITRLEKGNQYSWIPGGGMIIEVFVDGFDRAYTFGALMNRDETLTAIRDAASQRGCKRQEDKPSATWSSPTDKV